MKLITEIHNRYWLSDAYLGNVKLSNFAANVFGKCGCEGYHAGKVLGVIVDKLQVRSAKNVNQSI